MPPPVSDTDSAAPVVFLVDDDDSVRRSLERLLKLAGYRVEPFASPHELLDRLPYDGDGCVVTDLRLPGMTGIALQQTAHAQGFSLPFVFISGHGGVTEAVRAMKAGAVDFLEKPLDPQALLAAVQSALTTGLETRREKLERQAARRLVATLTPRERQVCELVGRGLLNKQIAAELGTSEKTVKTQRGKASRKLKATSTASLIDILRKADL